MIEVRRDTVVVGSVPNRFMPKGWLHEESTTDSFVCQAYQTVNIFCRTSHRYSVLQMLSVSETTVVFWAYTPGSSTRVRLEFNGPSDELVALRTVILVYFFHDNAFVDTEFQLAKQKFNIRPHVSPMTPAIRAAEAHRANNPPGPMAEVKTKPPRYQ